MAIIAVVKEAGIVDIPLTTMGDGDKDGCGSASIVLPPCCAGRAENTTAGSPDLVGDCWGPSTGITSVLCCSGTAEGANTGSTGILDDCGGLFATGVAD